MWRRCDIAGAIAASIREDATHLGSPSCTGRQRTLLPYRRVLADALGSPSSRVLVIAQRLPLPRPKAAG